MKLNQIELTLVIICTTFKLIYEFDFGSYHALGAGGNVFKEIYKEQEYYVNIKYLHENCFFKKWNCTALVGSNNVSYAFVKKWNCTALVGSNNVSYAFVMYLMNSERQNIFTDIIIIAGLLRVS